MPRTTVDIAGPVLAEVKKLAGQSGRPLGAVTSELLAEALAQRTAAPPRKARKFRWISKPMGALVDLEDKDALYEVLDQDLRMKLAEVAEP